MAVWPTLYSFASIQVAYKQKEVRLEDILECIRDAGFEADSLAAMPAEASGKASTSCSATVSTFHLAFILAVCALSSLTCDWSKSVWQACFGCTAPVGGGTTTLVMDAVLANAALLELQVSKFRVTGMHCSSCSTAVQRALAAITGVDKATVSLTLEEAAISYDPGLVQEVCGCLL